MQIPADKEIRAWHEKHAPSPDAFDLVYTHCAIVCGIAEQLLARSDLGLDGDLVRAGSLLHDIGVYRLYEPPAARAEKTIVVGGLDTSGMAPGDIDRYVRAAGRGRGAPVWAIDADGIVVRPGPRLVNGVEALASVIHPGAVPAAPPGSVSRVR